MKLIDDSDDYFLHDFSEENDNTASTPQPGAGDAPVTDTPDTPREQTERNFDFNGTPGVTPDPPARPRRRRSRWRRTMWWVFLVLFAVLAGAFYIRYFVPHTTESKVTGFITNVEKRGIVYKTFEGEMISQSRLVDKEHLYQRDVVFSIPDDSLGRALQALQGTGHPVELTVKRYYGTIPWRGATNTIVTSFREL